MTLITSAQFLMAVPPKHSHPALMLKFKFFHIPLLKDGKHGGPALLRAWASNLSPFYR